MSECQVWNQCQGGSILVKQVPEGRYKIAQSERSPGGLSEGWVMSPHRESPGLSLRNFVKKHHLAAV
jgi:hypothetical protein